MPGLMTNYFFALDTISSLDDKYKKMFNYNDKRIFLYSNFFNLPRYYKINNIMCKDNEPYDLENKLLNVDYHHIFDKFITNLKYNGYDKDNVLFLYSLVASYTLNKHFTRYVEAVATKANANILDVKKAIDCVLFEKIEKKPLYKTNISKKFKGAYIFTFSNIEIINLMVYESFKFLLPESFFKICVKNFKKFSGTIKVFKNPFYRLFDMIHKKPVNKRRTSFYYKKKDFLPNYLNHNKKLYEFSFEQTYDAAKVEALELLDAINLNLFYNNKKPFDKFFPKNKTSN